MPMYVNDAGQVSDIPCMGKDFLAVHTSSFTAVSDVAASRRPAHIQAGLQVGPLHVQVIE